MQSRELVKLYYRIGEVSEIVGVQPHVLRYWETEFRSIRPQKSSKGQRVYSRRDVEKLLRVKDLLKNQGFTIAGARKRLSEPSPAAAQTTPATALAPTTPPTPVLAASAPVAVASSVTGSIELDTGAKNMRRVLLGLRHDLARMLQDVQARKAR
jgi:DNA-binding transcriptional MerR regulator